MLFTSIKKTHCQYNVVRNSSWPKHNKREREIGRQRERDRKTEREREGDPALRLLPHFSFCLDVFQCLGLMYKVVRVGLGHKPSLSRRLDKVLISLLFRKRNRVLFGLEIEMGTLHKVPRCLPAHQRIFPPVALLQNVPVKAPLMATPIPRLCGRFGRPVDSDLI